MKIVIGNDHAGVEYKKELVPYLEAKGYEVINIGTDTSESCDYPIYGYKAAKMVANKQADLGILICGTGVGISLAANKVKGIRCCTCSETFSAKYSRLHNNTNMLAFGARVIDINKAKELVDVWLNTDFEGGHHQRRVDLISKIEETQEL